MLKPRPIIRVEPAISKYVVEKLRNVVPNPRIKIPAKRTILPDPLFSDSRAIIGFSRAGKRLVKDTSAPAIRYVKLKS